MRTVEEMLRRRCSQRRRQQLLIACLGGFFWFGLLGRRLLGPFYILRFLKGRVVAPSCPQPSIDMTPIQIIAEPIICILVDESPIQSPPRTTAMLWLAGARRPAKPRGRFGHRCQTLAIRMVPVRAPPRTAAAPGGAVPLSGSQRLSIPRPSMTRGTRCRAGSNGAGSVGRGQGGRRLASASIL